MNRNYWIATFLILAAFTALIVSDYYKLSHPSPTDPTSITYNRQLIKLGYCNAGNLKPCIVSFSRTETGMLVNILVPSLSYPEFYLLISRNAEATRYKCERVDDFPMNTYCEGIEILPGEVYRFTLVASKNNIALADGRFSIIGLLLATPEVESSPTSIPTPTSTETPTQGLFVLETVTPESATPTATEASYPNPSYPNPSYPNP